MIDYTVTTGHPQMYFQSVDELNEHVKNDHKEDNAEHICETCSQLYCSLRVLGQVHHMFSRFLNLRKNKIEGTPILKLAMVKRL